MEGPLMRIYVASSWRNLAQPGIVHMLRRCGHQVYDFRRPDADIWPERMPAGGLPPGGFSWRDVDPRWLDWTPAEYRAGLEHPIAIAGHRADMLALETCDACVLVLPSGRSASWEFGFAMGRGKRAFVVMLEPQEPELMYRGAEILGSMDELFDAFQIVPLSGVGQ